MGFFKKLFGGSEEETSNYNKQEHNQHIQANEDVNTTKENDCSIIANPHMITWENFFGVNLKKSPNELWEENELDYHGDNMIRNFTCYDVVNDYFSFANAKVIGKSATNFFFKCSYSWDDAFDIYFLIERDLVHHGNYTNTAAANRFRGNFDSYYDSFDWEIDGCNIRMSRDMDTGDIELGVWTTFYNKGYLDIENKQRVYNPELKPETADVKEDKPLPQKTIHVHLSGALETLHFVHDYMAEQLAGTAPCYVIQAVGNTIHVMEEDFCEVYSFESKDVSNYLNGRLGAGGFSNFNCDDMNDIQADMLVIPAGAVEEEHLEPESLVHYEMTYLVDPIEIDYRRKTIMDGKMNLNLVGIQYRDNYEELMDTIEEGMTVVLKPEPTNEFDANALAFYYNDEVIGYLPKKDQPFACIFMAKGQIEATICNIDEKWIDTEVVIKKDMIDFDAYNNNGVNFTRIESYKGGNQRRKSIEINEFVETI